MFRVVGLALAAAACVVIALPEEAEARCCSCRLASNNNHKGTRTLIKAQHRSTQTRVHGWLDELERAVVEALRLQTQQLSNYHKLGIEAMERIADAVQQNEALRLRQELRARAESEGRYDPDPTGCLTVERGGYPGRGAAPEAAELRNGDAAREPLPESPARSEGGAEFAAQQRDLRDGLGQKGISTTDLKAWLEGGTVERSPDRARATALLVQNMIDPMPPPEPTEERRDTPGGLVEDIERDGIRVRHSLVREAVSYALGLREGQTAPNGAAIRPGETMAKFAAQGLFFGELPEGARAVSELEALDVLTTFHHEPQAEESARRETELTSRNLMKRVYEVGALNARIAYLQLEVDSRRLMLEAAQLAAATPRPALQHAKP